MASLAQQLKDSFSHLHELVKGWTGRKSDQDKGTTDAEEKSQMGSIQENGDGGVIRERGARLPGVAKPRPPQTN